MTVPIKCPYCQRELIVPESMRGTTVRCGGCQAQFVAEDGGRPMTPPQSPPLVIPVSGACTDYDEDYGARSSARRPEWPSRRYRDEDEWIDRRPPPRRQSGLSLYFKIRLIILLTVVGIGALAVLGMILVGFCVAIFGKPSRGIPASDWKTLNSRDGRFAVDMPGQWNETNRPDIGLTRSGIHVFEVQIHSKDLGCYVHYFDAVADELDEQLFFEEYGKDLLGDFPGGRLVANRPTVASSGQAGREYHIDMPTGKVRRRVFVVKNRVYMVSVSSSRLDASASDVEKFFGSFAITN
jgi:hypothetical protein